MFRFSRGQSEVIGLVLLLGMTTLVVGTTVALGSVALDDSRSNAELQKAEAAMTQVDSKASLVAHGDSTSQHVDLGVEDDVRVVDDGRISVRIDDEEFVNERVGTLVYERDEATVAYQGGGVWRSDGHGSRMVSPPEFHYRGETLTLPLITIAGDGDVGDAVRLRSTDEPERRFPDETRENPVVGDNVTITIESEYHEAWGGFFEDRTDANVTRLDGNAVRVDLPTSVEGSAVTESMQGFDLTMGLDLLEIDSLHAESYDSTVGPPAESHGDDIVVYSDSEISGQPSPQIDDILIRGDLHTSGEMTPDENGLRNPPDEDELNVTGEVNENVAASSPVDMTGEIGSRHAAFDDEKPSEFESERDSLDGDSDPVVEDTYVDGDAAFEGASAELVANEETYVEIDGELSVTGTEDPAELLVDTNTDDDELHLMIRDDVTVEGDDEAARLRVIGDGTLFVYGDGDVEIEADDAPATVEIAGDADVRWFHGGDDVDIESDDAAAELFVEDDRAAGQFWFVTSADDIELDSNAQSAYFNGILYASSGGDATVTVDEAVTIDGALVADDTDLTSADLTLRYDEALGDGVFDDPFEERELSTINHLHVSVQEVYVGGDD